MAKVQIKPRAEAASASDYTPATAFLNISLKTKDGRHVRLGKFGLGLFADRQIDAYIIQRLTEGLDPNELLSQMSLTFTQVGEEKQPVESLFDF